MADLREPFELCKVLQTGSLIGIARHVDDDHVVLTFRDRGVLVYNLQHQKLINSWSVEQREEVTCPAVHNPIDANFLVAVNKTELFMWKESDSDFKKCQRFQTEKEIFSLLVWNSLQHDPLIMFEDGSSKFLAEIVSASERKRVKRHRTMESTQDFRILWSCVFSYQNQPYSGLIVHDKDKYIIKITNHSTSCQQENKQVEFELISPVEEIQLLACCICDEGHHITSYWSDGSLCVTEIETVLNPQKMQLDTKKPSLSCRILHRLHPLHTGSSKDRGAVALSSIDNDHVCLCGSSVIDGNLKDLIMVWNVKYGTLQSWQTLDKITTKQHSIPRPVGSDGACCVHYIPGFICTGFHHCVAVCQFSLDACSLASALGQLDSTAKFLEDESCKPQLLVTLKLARPGEALQNWSETMRKEDELEKEVLKKLTDPLQTPTLEAFSSELKNYMTVKLSKKDNKSKPGTTFHGKFGKKTEVLSQHFISAVLCRCISEKSFWPRECVSELLKTKCVPASCSKDLLNCVVEKNDLDLLKECFENIKGISEDSVVVCLRHVLRIESSSKENDLDGLQTEDDVHKMPLGKTTAKYLSSILSYPVNNVFLLPCLKQLSFEDAVLLMKFLLYLMDGGLNNFQGEMDCERLRYPQVLDWAGLLLNAHYTQLVITPEAHELLVSCHKIVAQQIKTYGKLRILENLLEHIKKRKPLPKSDKVGLYTIEELEL
ncbi:unnamed protein product [Porites lobata]|uniref:Nucleolar protein 11 n=1 Tax=Porites lobata TaxID=104759 RepID=A0ABN8MYI8_9CNID|nr:unnamed protein product [Porites lobata]